MRNIFYPNSGLRPWAAGAVVRTILVCLGVGVLGCSSPDNDLPPIQLEGELIRYASNAEICPATVTESEAWVRAVAGALQIDDSELLPITYYQLQAAEIADHCPPGGAACAEISGQGIAVYATSPLNKHELVHAIHLSVWDRRPPLLEEGLATVFDDELPQWLPVQVDPEKLADLVEVESAADDINVYTVGAYMTYWILFEQGASSVHALWDMVEAEMSASGFSEMFPGAVGLTLEELLSAADGMPACQITTCLGAPLPWTQGIWSMEGPGGCGDDRVVGMVTDEVEIYLKQELVEISQPGTYTLSTEFGAASIVACGQRCSGLGAGAFTAAAAFEDQPVEVVLELGVYRVEAQSVTKSTGFELQLISSG